MSSVGLVSLPTPPPWKAYGGPPFGDLSYFKDASGVVHFTGLACQVVPQDPNVCTLGNQINGTVAIFTLPVGFRPTSQQLFTAMSAGAGQYMHCRIDITTAGVVEVVAPPDCGFDWVSFDGFSFLAG